MVRTSVIGAIYKRRGGGEGHLNISKKLLGFEELNLYFILKTLKLIFDTILFS